MEVFSYDNLVRALSGGVASAFATTIFYPVETARTHIQVSKKNTYTSTRGTIARIVKNQGWMALYTGLMPVLLTIVLGNCVYFFLFHGLKASHSTQSAPQDLAFGFISGVTVGFITNPLWVIIIRMRTQGMRLSTAGADLHYNGIIDGMIKIIKEEGSGALWNGLLISLLLSLNPAINFMVYEFLRRTLTKYYQSKELGAVIYFIMGGSSKGFSTSLTYPFQVLQNRIRVKKEAESYMSGLLKALQDLIKEHGVAGLYLGLSSKVTQMVLTAALMFVSYEKLTIFVFRSMHPNLLVINNTISDST